MVDESQLILRITLFIRGLAQRYCLSGQYSVALIHGKKKIYARVKYKTKRLETKGSPERNILGCNTYLCDIWDMRRILLQCTKSTYLMSKDEGWLRFRSRGTVVTINKLSFIVLNESKASLYW